MPGVVHFEISAEDPAETAKFYEKVFGWKVTRWQGAQDYWLIDTGSEQPTINGGILKRTAPGLTTVNSIQVDSLDDFIERAEKAGGKVVVPKMTIEGVGVLAYLQDTDGNTFGMMQPDEAARR